MKKLVIIVVSILGIIVFTSCTKNYYMEAETQPVALIAKKVPVTTDNPAFIPAEKRMYISKLYIKKTNIDSVSYLGNFSVSENNQYDNQDHWVTVSRDYYVLSAPKYWGVSESEEYISSSKLEYVISAQFLNELRVMIATKSTIIVFFGFNSDFGCYEINGWTEQ